MANFYDIGDVGPNTDPNPIQGDGGTDDLHKQDNIGDNVVDDQMNQREPGLGGQFNGDDPSIWHTTGEAEEPTAQTDATPPVLSLEAQELYDELIAAVAIEPVEDETILTFAESVAELEAIFAELNNADILLEPVGDPIAEMEAGVIAAAVEDAVVVQAIDTQADVAKDSALWVIFKDIARYTTELKDYWDTDQWREDDPWWQDPDKVKAFLGINWDGFLDKKGEINLSGFNINNPAWMSPDIKWDNNVPWFLQFDSALASSNYQWFSGDYGMALDERFGEQRTNMRVAQDADDAFSNAIDSPEDEYPLTDSIFTSLADLSDVTDGTINQLMDTTEFNIFDDTSTGEWDEGLL